MGEHGPRAAPHSHSASTQTRHSPGRWPLSGMGFPNIPGVVYNGIHYTGDLLDFGPRFNEGILTVLPPNVDTPYKVHVPKTDRAGNDIAGIRRPRYRRAGRDIYRLGVACIGARRSGAGRRRATPPARDPEAASKRIQKASSARKPDAAIR